MAREIGLAEVREAADRVLAKAGAEFQYRPNGNGDCVYHPDERNPYGCLVGAILTELGVYHVILPDDIEGAETRQQMGITGLLREPAVKAEVEFSGSAVQWLFKAQVRQDSPTNPATWGEAVEAADAYAGE